MIYAINQFLTVVSTRYLTWICHRYAVAAGGSQGIIRCNSLNRNKIVVCDEIGSSRRVGWGAA